MAATNPSAGIIAPLGLINGNFERPEAWTSTSFATVKLILIKVKLFKVFLTSHSISALVRLLAFPLSVPSTIISASLLSTASKPVGSLLLNKTFVYNYIDGVNLDIIGDEEYTLTHHINQTYEALLSDTQASALLSAYFDLGQLKSLLNQFNQASLLFSEQDMHLIHGDIKRSNLMRDRSGELYLIDIESMKYGHDTLQPADIIYLYL